MNNFFDLQYSDLEELLNSFSQPRFRLKQVWEGAYRNLEPNWKHFSNLPKDLREKLQENYSLNNLEAIDEINAFDGCSTKFLFSLPDGNSVESVILRSDNRITLCISTQSGCPVGCVFCATGKFGFHRNLTSGEIIEQVIFLVRLLKQNGESVNNIVIMGMGEPMLNYDATLTAIRRFNDPEGLNIGARRITLSTIGIPEKIRQFAHEDLQVNLAISLHAPNDVLRRQLVPIAEKSTIAEIIDACRDYITATNRRVTFEYVLIDQINNLPQHAHELSNLLKGFLCHVNLIGLNPTNHYSGKTPKKQAIRDFGKILLANHIPTSIRNSQGSDIQAACGQLAGKLTH
jgi:23S rRNA (adenine2503-C2)-methyltransferase